MRPAIPRSISFGLAILVLALAVFGIAFVFGTHRPFTFVGDWEGRRAIRGQPGADPGILETLAKVELHIHDNERFDLTDGGLDYSGPVAYAGGSAILTPDTVVGTPVSRQPEPARAAVPTVRLTPTPDGNITETETTADDEPVVLKRSQR